MPAGIFNDRGVCGCSEERSTAIGTLHVGTPKDIPGVHLMFSDMRAHLDLNMEKLKKIEKTLAGKVGCEEVCDAEHKPFPMPHECDIKSNFDVLKTKLAEQTDLINCLFTYLGIDECANI